jgi:DNA-binding MarR family transcriptional regulator
VNIEKIAQRITQLGTQIHQLNKTSQDELGLSFFQYHLLNTLRKKPGQSLQKLAQNCAIHPSTLTQSLKPLLKRKLVGINIHPSDSRSKILFLTKTGNDSLVYFSEKFAILNPLLTEIKLD